MRKPDYAHKLTDKQLAELEQRIAKLYKEAADELTDTVRAYFEQFEKRDAAMKEKLDAGEITEQQYKQWRLAQMGRGKRFTALRDKVAERYTNANETAVAYVNDATPGIYSLNRNYAAYKIEQVSDKADFTLWDEQTVKRLIVEQPDLMPYYPPKRALQRGIDLKYGKQQITASVTSSILQGKSIPKIANDLQSRMQDMNRTSAIRTARTAVTAAQNAGRLDTYRAAQDMGIKLKKRWLATLDNRTRHAHAMLDGQTVDIDKPFKVDGFELMYPGDSSAPGYLVYNCRCTQIAEVDGEDTSSGGRRAIDPETGESVLVKDMSGTATANADGPTFPIWHLPPGKYCGLNSGAGVSASVVVQRNARDYWIESNGVFEILAGDVCKYFYLLVTSGTTIDKTVYPYIVSGTTAPTTYTPYIGQTNTLTLPETVYGGEVDAVSGDGSDKYHLIAVNGTEIWHYGDTDLPNANGYIRYSVYNIHAPAAEKYVSQAVVGISSVGKTGDTGPITSGNVVDFRQAQKILIFNVKASEKVYPLENWKAYLAAQYAAGTPVQIAYKLATPTPFTATGAQPLPALAGVNTVLTDADSATVTGRADPIKRITDLEDAVASQT